MENATDQARVENIENMISDAESRLREGIDTLSAWSDQVRDVIQNRPGVVLAGIAVAGFVTGLVARRGPSLLSDAGARTTSSAGFGGDPLIVFMSGALAGFTLGPRILREVAMGNEFGRSSVSSTGAATSAGGAGASVSSITPKIDSNIVP